MYRGSLSKFSLHLLSSVMLTNTRGTQDLWISEMSGTFFLYIIHPHPLCAPTICYPRPGTHTHTQTLQFVFLSLQVTSSGWAQKFMSLSVNMQRLQWAEGVKRAADNAWCVSDVCSHVQDKDWVGGGGWGWWFTEPLNWGIMVLKTLMELSSPAFVERTQEKYKGGWHR